MFAGPVHIPDVVLRSELLVAGWSPDEIRRMVTRGDLRRLGRGTYTTAGPAPADRRVEHVLRVRAVVRRLDPTAVVSHASAAAVHGLPCWGLPLDRVVVTRARVSGARRSAELLVRAAPLPDHDVTSVMLPGDAGTLRVTAPARTVVDVARTYGFEQAVVVADAALARPRRDVPPLVTPDELVAAVADAGGRPGAAAARRVATFADGRSGSPGESRSRVAMDAAGLAVPVLQYEIRDAVGVHVATVDFAWPERRTVGEFDGKIKYGRLLRPGEEPGDAVYREKLREDAIRAEGWTVVRWRWQEIRPFTPVLARLRPRLG
ncbi:type IV toxin-antitoxin system AbiEi family antitoxin domain-containing protein [Pseudonocardia endophytica]|uniref:Putative AbiEi antitoxin of type IV toxin-antitoxin system n=1 Tax=Pseudonocardia endophytica TaxID=401976 RepID=A0A4R1HZ63_PSEEN|nr:type IV toxin-antitoxin system AbiEi family antitoxin domain-containing protein [Pseudonocardia endophytica]TCK26180.1 putative AbiEi antitoxin of type IV toxin-antitoxin system [Pseudonocardia endophytica]